MNHLLETKRISKSYGTNRVLSDVDFTLEAGESVAVIGENGAGKSTLAKILTGVIRPDGGEIYLNGKQLSFNSPRDALRHGIAFIPQELAYVPRLSVAENILLGQWPSWGGVTSKAAILARAREECRRFGIKLDVDRLMVTLKLADRQIVDIVKALARNAKLILLDEPMAALSEQESLTLFNILKQLAQEGVGIIYISHRMDEVYRFSDRVDVLRNGDLVASVPPSQTTPQQLIAYMLGQEKEKFTLESNPVGAGAQAVVELRGWTREGIPPLSGVNLWVGRGEIVGLFGLRGSGTDLIAEGLAGLHPDINGELVILGQKGKIFSNPSDARRASIAFVPADRKRDGLVMTLPVKTNLTLLILKQVARLGLIRGGRERVMAGELTKRFDVRCSSLNQKVAHLSGGNQQKVLLASRMAAQPMLMVLQEPTRGVDVGARVEIHKFMAEIAAQGGAALLVSSDLEETVAVSNRLLVMREGSIVGELTGSHKTQANAIALAAGSAA